jgi:hypothetical protein
MAAFGRDETDVERRFENLLDTIASRDIVQHISPFFWPIDITGGSLFRST